MLRLLLLIVLVLIGGFALSYLHSYPNSYLLLTLGNISIETTLGIALALGILAVLLLWQVFALLRGIISIPGGIASNWRWWRREQRQAQLNKLALKLVSGEHRGMGKLLGALTDKELGSFERQAVAVRARLMGANPASAAPLLDSLESVARSAAHKQHAMRLRAEFWLKCGEYENLTGLELPAHLKRMPFWREAIATAAAATGKWEALVRQLKAGKHLPRRLWLEALMHVDAGYLLDRVWSAMPDALKDQPGLARVYLERLIAAGRIQTAQNFLLHIALKPELLELMTLLGSFNPEKPEKLLSQLEKRYRDFCARQQKDGDADDFFALGLGKLCQKLKLVGKAEDYLAPLVHHSNFEIARQANLAMAQLLAQREDYTPAIEHLQAVDLTDSPLVLTRLKSD